MESQTSKIVKEMFPRMKKIENGKTSKLKNKNKKH